MFKVKSWLIKLSVAFLVSGSVCAAGSNESSSLKLVPTPQRSTLLDGVFKMQKTASVIVGNPQDTHDLFAARQLVEEIQQQLGFNIEIGKQDRAAAEPVILIGRLGRDTLIDGAVTDLKIDLDSHCGYDSYVLSITPKQILIAGKDAAGTFYGVQTLKQIVRANRTGDTVPCCLIQDWPGLGFRAWLEDVTRGPVPKMETLKRKIRAMAEVKANMLTMYTEHVFKLKKHPKLAPPDGLTADEIKELSDYAKKHHVDLVGNFQSLGHFWNILKHPEYAHLKETTDIVTPAKEETYQFLKEVYSEIVPAYSSQYFHACGDEVFRLGHGPARDMVKQMGVGGVYAYHFNRINDLLTPYGKTLMLWVDMMKRYPDDMRKLPEDVILIPWSYNTWQVDNYDKVIRPVVETGRRVMVCSSIKNSGRMWPEFENGILNNAMWTRECVKYKGLGIFHTSWCGAGEAFYGYNWYPFLWGAESAWMPVVSEEGRPYGDVLKKRVSTFDRGFDAIFYGSAGGIATVALNRLEGLRRYKTSTDKGDYIRLSNRVFWNDPFQNLDNGITDDADADPAAMLADADKVVATLEDAKRTSRFNVDTLDYALFAARRAAFVARRQLQHNAVVRYKRDGQGSLEQLQHEFVWLSDELASLKGEYIRLWHQENRDSWLEHIVAKYDTLMTATANRDLRVVMPKVDIFSDTITVELGTYLGKGDIRYTLDGSEPNTSSLPYTGPFVLKDTTLVRARAYDGNRRSVVSRKRLTRLRPGDCIVYSCYESAHPYVWEKLPDFDLLTPTKTGTVKAFDISLRAKDDFFAFSFSGFVHVAEEGEYTFFIKSDDGSTLWVDGQAVVVNDGLHGSVEKSGKIDLKPGAHVVTALYFDCLGYEDLAVAYEGPGIKKQVIDCCP